MGCKAGSFVLPVSGPFSITGIGFKPRWMILLFSNGSSADEEIWTGIPAAGIGWISMVNSALDTSGVLPNIWTCSVSEMWDGSNVGGSFLGDVTSWVRTSSGGGGWALVPVSLDDDGMTLRYATGFSSGAAGRKVYYLAGDDEYEQVAGPRAFVPGSPLHELGWEPQAFFGIGAGGPVSAPGGTQSQSWLDISIPSVCAGNFGDTTGGNRHTISQYRGIVDPNVNVQEWWGWENSGAPVIVLEETQAGGTWLSSQFDPHRTETAFDADWLTGGGFSQGHARMQPIIFGQVACVAGSFIPSLDVGVPMEVALPFSPDAIIFFSPQDDKAGVFNTSVYGATVWGFCTADDQAVLAYGGLWNPPTPMQRAQFHSGNLAWMGNCIESGVVGSLVNAGSARCIPNGFEYETLINTATSTYPVHYWAIGSQAEAPGFFRVLHR